MMRTSIHSGSTGNIRHPPRDGFTASFALFPGTIGCVDPVGPLLQRLAARLGSTHRQRTLTQTMERQNHATSPSASAPVVDTRSTPLTVKPPCDAVASDAACVHRTPSHVRDDREAPLVAEQDEGSNHILPKNGS